MGKVGLGGPKRGGFVESVGAHRREIVRANPDVEAGVLGPPSKAEARPLVAAGLSGKLVDLHWPHLADAVGPAGKLAEAGNKLTGNPARVYTRAFANTQKIVSALLSALPEAERSEAATRTLTALAKVVESIGANALLPTALSAATGLIDAGVRMRARGTLEMTPDDLKRLGEDAADAVMSLLDGIRDRRGQSSMLNVLPRIVEELQLAHPKLDAAGSRAITQEVAEAITNRLPKSGTDLSELAQVTALVSQYARKKGAKLDRVLDQAFSAHAAERKEAIEIARGGLNENPPVDQALGRLLDANPTAPDSLLDAVEQLVAAARPYAARKELMDPVAKAVTRFAETPVGETVARHLATHMAQLQNPNAIPLLTQAVEADNGNAFAAQLIRAHLVAAGQPAEAHDALLPALDRLSEAGAVQVASVFGEAIAAGRGSPDLFEMLIERAEIGRDDDPIGTLERHARTHQTLSGQLAHHPAIQEEKKALAEAVAAVPPDGAAMGRLLSGLSTIKQYLPNAPLEKLVNEDKDGRPGLAQLALSADWAEDPINLLAQLCQDIQAQAAGKRDEQGSLARAAIALALQCSGIQNAGAFHLPRIREDWRLAVEDPGALKSAARPQQRAVGVRAKESVIGFLDAHPELPIDFAFTAGRYLTPDQIAWAADRLGKARGLDSARFLRDTVFALVATNRLDVMDAIVNAKSPPKAVSAVLKELASRLQLNDAQNAPFDAIVEGLKAGTDPIAEMKAREAKEAFQGVDLNQLAEGQVTDEGLAEVLAIKENVADLLTQYDAEFAKSYTFDNDVDMAKLREPYLQALKATLQGTWPKPKYEDEIGVRQLSICTPEQRAIWRQRTVTMEQDEEVPAAPIDTAIVPLAHGLAKALEQEVHLAHPDLDGLSWDAATRDRLHELRDGLIEEARNAKKGSDAHRDASAKIRPITALLRVVELKLALDPLEGEENPAAIAAALGPVVGRAVAPLRKLGARGCASAARKIRESVRSVSGPQAREMTGAYAVDEDSLTAMIDSHKSGCLSFGDKRRRWGMCGSLTDANTKMLHTFRDGKQKYRTFLRLLPAKFGGYEGPVLFIETPRPDSGGQQADLALLHKGLYAKARAMGVPVVNASQNVPDGWTRKNENVTLTFDWGHTGLYHSDLMGQVKFQNNGGKPEDRSRQLTVSIPPELAARLAN